MAGKATVQNEPSLRGRLTAPVGPCGLCVPVLCYLSPGEAEGAVAGAHTNTEQREASQCSSPTRTEPHVSQGNAEMVKEMKSRLFSTCLWETAKAPCMRLHSRSQMLLFLQVPPDGLALTVCIHSVPSPTSSHPPRRALIILLSHGGRGR